MSEINKTDFDGKKAKIIGIHPHNGSTAVCQGTSKTLSGWGMIFKCEEDKTRVFRIRS